MMRCARIALEDEYFIKRKLYPNVDFYTGLIYQSMGFPMTMFPVLLLFRAPPAGFRSGKRCCSIRAEDCASPADLFGPRHSPLRTHRGT